MDTTLDPQVVALAKAIRDQESGGDFQAKGGSGEFGAYQFMPGTWEGSAKKYLGADIPVQQASPEQQNEVAYKKIKEWKDSGYNPAQIASLWNSGSPDWQGKVGTNSHGVHYDTPSYVNKVYSLYQKYKGGSGDNPVMHSAQASSGNGMAGTTDNQTFQPGDNVPGTGGVYPDFNSGASDLSEEDLVKLKQLSGPEGNLVGLAGGYGLMGQLADKAKTGAKEVAKGFVEPVTKGIASGLRGFEAGPQLVSEIGQSAKQIATGGTYSSKTGQKVPWYDAFVHPVDTKFVLKSNKKGDFAEDILKKPVMGQKTLSGDSTAGNVKTAATALLQAIGAKEPGAITNNSIIKGALGPVAKAANLVNPLSGGPVASVMKILIGNKIINSLTGGKENLLGGLIKGLLD